mmetsp:Transcript_67574/g.147190  ORF Transcript_67574/g.147190 Transcript_67574/m.147190 type:complete len:151 (-) Transcript_67574:110-562(-)|eukprot:CAMPEP_0170593158 /NCGR_PEP_ID=MMETSP0224-20130122/13299_1 /TAXON_ID=285029 /ORGANISM="Togula jolla, Strain CCCM 725" /LENGTH=150 /DNA_ID=CAMNT_0010917093 /DNA_START=157 /DNA_END=609 /DNA_ORIENTATION=+
MVKRKRHNKKPDASRMDVSLKRNRGRLTVTPKARQKKTTKEMEEEVKMLKMTKTDLRHAKARRKRQPAPIEVRKALDHLPVDEGARRIREKRVALREAKREKRQAAKERRERLRKQKEARDAEELPFATLGDEFFSAADDAGSSTKVPTA